MIGQPLLRRVVWIAAFALAPAAAQTIPFERLFENGVAALRDGRLDAAEQAFRAALTRPGGAKAAVHRNLGIVYQQRGDHRSAVAEFDEAIRLRPAEAASWALAGASLIETGRLSDAPGYLEKAVEIEPDREDFRLQLARAYEHVDRIGPMVEQYRALKRIDPSNPEHAYLLGKAYLRLAAWSTRRMIEIDPESARVYQTLGENDFAQGKLDSAERALLRAAALDPDLPGVDWTLAQVRLKRGDKPGALQALEKELEIMPESVLALRLKKSLQSPAAP